MSLDDPRSTPTTPEEEQMSQSVAKYLLVCLYVLAASAMPARAQQADLPGVYTFDATTSDDMKAAVDRGTADMNFAIRGIARSRIAQTNPRYERIAISRNDKTVSVQFDQRPPIVLPLDGHSVPVAREDGEQDDVTAQWSATQLVLDFKSDKGERLNTFVFAPDGKSLKLDVKLMSSHFSAPITYVLAYRRQAS
jgi:hypothetical protein